MVYRGEKVRRCKEERGLAMAEAQGRGGGERQTPKYISIYSFGRRQHGSLEHLLMLLLDCLARGE